MQNFHEKLQEKTEKLSEKMKKEHNEFMQKLKDDADELDDKSANNFTAWRDFLYRYFVFIAAFIGGSGLLQKVENLQNNGIILGTYFGLSGVVIGILGINLHFYIERKRFQIEHYINVANPYELFDHPDSDGDIRKGIKLNLQEKNLEKLKRIKELKKNKNKNSTEIKKLKLNIKADTQMIKQMKYFGEMFGFIERIWFYTVGSSVGVSLIGVVVIIFNLLNT